MVDFGRGIKAGIIAGIIWGIISVILSIVVAMIYWQAILSGTYGITVTSADMMGVLGFYLVSWIVGGIVIGIILLFVGAGIIPSTLGIIKEKTVFTGFKSNGYIQDLIDNASIGDTIKIPSGTYFENIIYQ